MEKRALLIIDMQKEVLQKLAKVGQEVVPKVQRALEIARKQGIPVFHIKREHRKSGVDVELFRLDKFKEKPFLVEGSEGAEIVPELEPLPNEYIVSKRRFSAFFQTDLLMLLTRLQITSLIIAGVQTPNCIRSTVIDALGYDFEVTVLEDATAAMNIEIHKANLLDMSNMGVHLQKTMKEC